MSVTQKKHVFLWRSLNDLRSKTLLQKHCHCLLRKAYHVSKTVSGIKSRSFGRDVSYVDPAIFLRMRMVPHFPPKIHSLLRFRSVNKKFSVEYLETRKVFLLGSSGL